MKKTIIGIALAIGITLAFTSKSVKADVRPVPGAVVVAATEFYENGYPTRYIIFMVSQGQNAPTVRPGMDLAPTLEMLLSQGFEIKESEAFRFIATRK